MDEVMRGDGKFAEEEEVRCERCGECGLIKLEVDDERGVSLFWEEDEDVVRCEGRDGCRVVDERRWGILGGR